MKQIRKGAAFVLLAIALVAGVQSFISCDLEGSDSSSDSLVGYWKSSYGDGYKIYWDSDLDSYSIEYSPVDIDSYDDSFKGLIMQNVNFQSSEGYIVFKCIEKGNMSFLEIGKYSAVHWKDFLGDTVKMATAFIYQGDKNSGFPTEEEAAAEYTVENGYYTLHGDYERQ
ncbi:MAG: hypothetical protein KA771_06140 [Spirochaetales bacterium]|nr:hypothetical protein [Spirochaetales bacterium]